MMRQLVFSALLFSMLLFGCGTANAPSATSATTIPGNPAPSPTGPITLAQVFDGGSYRCTIESSQGPITMEVSGKKFRYEGSTPQGPIKMIVLLSSAETQTYTYVAQQDKWYHFTFRGASQSGTPIITKENTAQFPKYECAKASIPESEFTVPADQIVEQPTG